MFTATTHLNTDVHVSPNVLTCRTNQPQTFSNIRLQECMQTQRRLDWLRYHGDAFTFLATITNLLNEYDEYEVPVSDKLTTFLVYITEQFLIAGWNQSVTLATGQRSLVA